MIRVVSQFWNCGLMPQRSVHSQKFACTPARQDEGTLPQCFAGNRAGVQPCTANLDLLLHQCDASTEKSGGHGPAGTSPAAAEHHQLEVLWFHEVVDPITRFRTVAPGR